MGNQPRKKGKKDKNEISKMVRSFTQMNDGRKGRYTNDQDTGVIKQQIHGGICVNTLLRNHREINRVMVRLDRIKIYEFNKKI